MVRALILRFRQRRAVSTIIAGLIILSLILTTLGTMVAVSQQYDQYQQTFNKMARYENQERSENLTPVSPGLAVLTSAPSSGWGTSCVTAYTCYNLTLSNLGGVGVQIVRIYINSTTSGCVYPNQPCILGPSGTIAQYTFNQASQFLNPGEINHSILLALPTSMTLPSTYYSQNTIFIVTSRGNVFSFQWPFPIQIFGGQSQSAFSAGILKIAYQDISGNANPGLCVTPQTSGTYAGYPTNGASGCDSIHDYSGASGNTWSNTPYCHHELEASYPAPTDYAEPLSGITYNGVPVKDGGTLYFVNPWITLWVLEDARTDGETITPTPIYPTTQLYIYINITNTGGAPYNVAGGSLDLTFSGSNHIDGNLIGIYYNATVPGNVVAPAFYSTSSTQTVAVGKSFYAIFIVTYIQLDLSYLSSSNMFWGTLSLTSNTETTGFVGGVGLSSGLWIRYVTGTSTSC